MGLTLAYRLSQQGYRVTVFERSQQLGGLTTHHDYKHFVWDRFYHVILPSDTHLIPLLQEIGLGDRLRWQQTRTGFYIDRQLHSISNTVEFLSFPVLNPIDKVRLAFTLLYASRVKNWRRLEKITVKTWLLRLSGRGTYEKLWKPLLLAKLGEQYHRVSAVFIWSYIKRLFSARDSSLKKEQLGYVAGGYKAVFDRLATLIGSMGGEIHTGATVKRIAPCPTGGLWLEQGQTKQQFDKVIFTGTASFLDRIADQELVHTTGSAEAVEYLGVICMALITRKPLVPYYVVNVADSQIPFTGIIGASNLIDLKETAGLHLTYLPKYVLSNDPLLQQSDSELRHLFLRGLRSMFPALDVEDVVAMHIHRATKVQPLQVLNYSRLVPQTVTLHNDFFVLNSSQFVNDTLNNNTVVRYVDEFVDVFSSLLKPHE